MAPRPLSVRAKVERYVSNIASPEGEGAKTFVKTYVEQARIEALKADEDERLGIDPLPLAGVVVSIKDLFDVRGETTMAGSRAMKGASAAARDAEIVRRIRRAGGIIVGRTNMTEFAFSGLGLNPHYGTPANPWQRSERRIPGGSSSGAAISVSDQMADVAIGTDTGGSVRIPAALCGLVGFKPTAGSVPMLGTLPLSPSYDSIGPLAKTVDECASLYAILSGSTDTSGRGHPQSPTLLVLKNYVLDGLDQHVAQAYERALSRLAAYGYNLVEHRSSAVDELPRLFEDGGIVAAEAFAWHERLIEESGSLYDPRVRSRIERGAKQRAADHIRTGADAIVMPTAPVIAPRIDGLEASDDVYSHTNLLMLRNPTVVNALDGCAITLPCHEPGTAPVGIMLAGIRGRDWRLLSLATPLEALLQ